MKSVGHTPATPNFIKIWHIVSELKCKNGQEGTDLPNTDLLHVYLEELSREAMYL
jgi:hypothetical protein